ncbi:hypothetical protein OB894_09150 [Bacillus subtilis]|uniref:hypothetical protein n=1 Tax=Bacillus subtilis TaxID=1423 RepID=UPI0016426679|nr:hypothetical protein [Bacillus subtilis]MEC2236276.1 hypothetical protein [Bacillus subtilis]
MAVQVISSATFISTMLALSLCLFCFGSCILFLLENGDVLLFTRFIDSDPVWLYIEGREIITKTSHKEKVCFN